MTTTTTVCVGALYHSPVYVEVDRHHIFPLYLCDLLGVPDRVEVAPLCSGCHDTAHHLIRHLVNEGSLGGHRPASGARTLVDRFWSWWQATVLVPQ